MKVQLKRGNVWILEVKFEFSVNWGIEEIAVYANVDTTTVLEILNTHPEELSKDKHIDPKEESDDGKQG